MKTDLLWRLIYYKDWFTIKTDLLLRPILLLRLIYYEDRFTIKTDLLSRLIYY